MTPLNLSLRTGRTILSAQHLVSTDNFSAGEFVEMLLEDGRRDRGSVDELVTNIQDRKLFHIEDAASIWRLQTS